MIKHSKIVEAEVLIKRACELAPTPADKALAWQELSVLHRVVNRFEDAEKCFAKSLKMLESLGRNESNDRRILSAYRETTFRLGELRHIMGKADEARNWYMKSLAIDDRLNDDPFGAAATRKLLDDLAQSA
jgi:tetratricopeptide (TPR) repeat protein